MIVYWMICVFHISNLLISSWLCCWLGIHLSLYPIIKFQWDYFIWMSSNAALCHLFLIWSQNSPHCGHSWTQMNSNTSVGVCYSHSVQCQCCMVWVLLSWIIIHFLTRMLDWCCLLTCTSCLPWIAGCGCRTVSWWALSAGVLSSWETGCWSCPNPRPRTNRWCSCPGIQSWIFRRVGWSSRIAWDCLQNSFHTLKLHFCSWTSIRINLCWINTMAFVDFKVSFPKSRFT